MSEPLSREMRASVGEEAINYDSIVTDVYGEEVGSQATAPLAVREPQFAEEYDEESYRQHVYRPFGLGGAEFPVKDQEEEEEDDDPALDTELAHLLLHTAIASAVFGCIRSSVLLGQAYSSSHMYYLSLFGVASQTSLFFTALALGIVCPRYSFKSLYHMLSKVVQVAASLQGFTAFLCLVFCFKLPYAVCVGAAVFLGLLSGFSVITVPICIARALSLAQGRRPLRSAWIFVLMSVMLVWAAPSVLNYLVVPYDRLVFVGTALIGLGSVYSGFVASTTGLIRPNEAQMAEDTHYDYSEWFQDGFTNMRAWLHLCSNKPFFLLWFLSAVSGFYLWQILVMFFLFFQRLLYGILINLGGGAVPILVMLLLLSISLLMRRSVTLRPWLGETMLVFRAANCVATLAALFWFFFIKNGTNSAVAWRICVVLLLFFVCVVANLFSIAAIVDATCNAFPPTQVPATLGIYFLSFFLYGTYVVDYSSQEMQGEMLLFAVMFGCFSLLFSSMVDDKVVNSYAPQLHQRGYLSRVCGSAWMLILMLHLLVALGLFIFYSAVLSPVDDSDPY